MTTVVIVMLVGGLLLQCVNSACSASVERMYGRSARPKPYREQRRVKLTIGFAALAGVVVLAFSGVFH